MKTIVGNWKMKVGTRESVALARGTILALRGKKVLPDIVICPPYVALSEVRKVVVRSKVSLGAQNMFWEEQGSYTGEISSRMLLELGVSHVILGHSERREILGETDEMVNDKLRRAVHDGLTAILCVGENAQERKAGEARDRVAFQVQSALSGLKLKRTQKLFIAYEPIWAIGTGDSAFPVDAVEMHSFIRSLVKDLLPSANAGQVQILYGGSVEGENAYSFLREDEIDGVLVGGASVKLSQFKEIISSAIDIIEGQMGN